MKTILQLEDDPNDVFSLQHAMKKAGVAKAIQVANDGQEPIDYRQGAGRFADREQFPFPSLLLLDLNLPYVMGLDALKWMRKQSGMRLVALLPTASGEDTDIAAAYRLGANGFLVKPSEASKLQDMVKAIQDFWVVHNILPQESYRERTAVAAHSRGCKPGAMGLPGVIGAPLNEVGASR